ncbi:MAG: OB-fold domain-containing protein [Thermoplasmata archaeon]|nr:OB-fold domain-containing protein [Candidatus Sysuiplasma acidicola]MBX8646416.1 OB-fold domain-containing protein [Candidatus Sysuiplasma acidicola]MDH2906348.1 OB-fold domain-containing protein [Methanomassiliicoccales archaeon]
MTYIGQVNAAVEEGKLTGYSCAKCGRKGVTFAVACPSCGSVDLTPFTFSGRGTIRTFTILTVPSEQFVNDAPYTYVVVDLDEGCGVSGWMPDVRSKSDISTGDAVRFTKSYKRGIVFEKVKESA